MDERTGAVRLASGVGLVWVAVVLAAGGSGTWGATPPADAVTPDRSGAGSSGASAPGVGGAVSGDGDVAPPSASWNGSPPCTRPFAELVGDDEGETCAASGVAPCEGETLDGFLARAVATVLGRTPSPPDAGRRSDALDAGAAARLLHLAATASLSLDACSPNEVASVAFARAE